MKISDFERVCDEHDKLTEQVATLSRQLAEAQEARDLNAAALECYSAEQARLRKELAEAQAERGNLWEMAAVSFQWMRAHDLILGFIQKNPALLHEYIAWDGPKPEYPNPDSTRKLAEAFAKPTEAQAELALWRASFPGSAEAVKRDALSPAAMGTKSEGHAE